MAIRWEDIQNLLVTNEEINKLAGLTATASDINKLDGFTGTTQDLNDGAGAAAAISAHEALDFTHAHTIIENSLDGLTIVDGTLTENKLAFAVVSPDELVPMQTQIDGLISDNNTQQDQIDNLYSIVLPGQGNDIADAIQQTIEHIEKAVDAHDASAISYGNHYSLIVDVNSGDTSTVLDSKYIKSCRIGEEIKFQDDETVSETVTITDIDYDTSTITFNALSHSYAVAKNGRFWLLSEDAVNEALDRALRNTTDIFSGRLSIIQDHSNHALVLTQLGSGDELHFTSGVIGSDTGYDFELEDNTTFSINHDVYGESFLVNTSGDGYLTQLKLREDGTAFHGTLTKNITADRTWTFRDIDNIIGNPDMSGNSMKYLRVKNDESDTEWVIISAQEVTYDNSSSGLAATNVQDAIDESDQNLDDHVSDTSNPHHVTITQAVDADSGTDITTSELETLSDGSNADGLHTHDHGSLDGLADPDHAPTAVTTQGVIKDGGLSASDVDAKNVFETLNKLLGQFRLKEHPTNKKRVVLTGADRILNDGTTLSQVVKNLLLKFEGAEIDFSQGKVYGIDGTTDLGLDFTPASIPAGEWHWYTVAVVPSTVNADLTINGQVLVVSAANSGSTKDDAEKAPFTNNTNIGMVAIQEQLGDIADISQSDIRQLGVGSGSGGGGGLGDLTAIEEELRSSLRYSDYQWVTPLDYRKVGDDYTESGTVSYDIANSYYKFNAGEYLETVNLLDDGYKKEIVDTRKVDVHVFQGVNKDELFSVSITPNGSSTSPTYIPVTFKQIGVSGHYIGTVETNVSNIMDPVLDLSPTTHNWLSFNNSDRRFMAMPFKFDEKVGVNKVTIKMDKTGSPSGLISCRVVGDNGGNPDFNNTIANSAGVLCQDMANGTSDIDFNFVRFTVAKDTLYHILLEPDSNYENSYNTSNYVSIDTGDKPAAYTNGTLHQYNGSAWSELANTAMDMHFAGNVFDLRIRYTAGTDDSILEGLGLLYGDSYDLIYGGDLRNTQTFFVNGDDDQTDFVVGNFLPDGKILKVYDPTTGQVYTHEAFAVSGYTVTFPSGTFNVPGETFYLHFDQYEGNGFDNSDTNRNALASNHLGSTNPDADFSVAGRGIILRRPDGVLREIRINNNDELEILEV